MGTEYLSKCLLRSYQMLGVITRISGQLSKPNSVPSRYCQQLKGNCTSRHVRRFSTKSEELGRKSKRKQEDNSLDLLNKCVNQYKEEAGPVAVSSPSAYTFRTHTCGELSSKDVGDTVTLCGWLTFKRLNGAFMVLRDLYGVTQIYLPKELEEDFKKAADAPLESVLQINGVVTLRPEKQRRKDQTTGDIEIVVEKLTVLNTPHQLRLSYNDFDKADEELSIKYRYLYLRNAHAQATFRNRAIFLGNIRRFMNTNHFIDIETPTLLRRTPGGAREFPVVTKFKNSYYALAQSPQLLKQLLMAAGMDKYYQLARCYRDEGGKPDRQPEFTQLDLEMSFTTREGVMKLVEDLLRYSCPKSIFRNSQPFPVLTYKQCMDEYGSDKPNTGGFVWVVDFPLFLKNDQSGKLEAAHHPFTMPKNESQLYTDPENVTGLSYDLVFCGAEVGGGSVRIHDAQLQKYVFQDVLKLPLEDIDYLLNALESGCPPHGGFALGVDRFLCKMLGTHSIRDVIAFPKSSEGKDLLSGAPSPLDADAKKYYDIK